MYGRISEDKKIQYFTPYKGGLKSKGMIIINPTEEQYNSEGWYQVENISEDGEPTLEGNVIKNYTGAPTLDEIKNSKISEIKKYDTSKNVNEFFVNDTSLWIPRETRVSLQNSTAILLKNGIETASLWYENLHFSLPCTTLLKILDTLEIYALQCFNKTSEHEANVISFTTKEDIESYDYTIGYPSKLHFSI